MSSSSLPTRFYNFYEGQATRDGPQARNINITRKYRLNTQCCSQVLPAFSYHKNRKKDCGQSRVAFTSLNDGQAQILGKWRGRRLPRFEWRNDRETNLSSPSRHVSEGRGCGRGRDLPCQLAVDLGRQSSSSFQLVDSEGDSILSTL